MPRLLVIDDEQAVRYSFRRVFSADGIDVLTAATAAEGVELARTENPDVIVLDLQLPDRSGLEVLKTLRDLAPQRPIVFITAHGTTDSAIEAMKQGAFDYLVKPVDLAKLSQLLARAFQAAHASTAEDSEFSTTEEADSRERIVGRSAIVQEMCKIIGRVAPQEVNVLILGESGVGKELVVRAIHQHSQRAHQPLHALNCAALPETLLESELFGHEQGAFTGAVRRRIGKFELASAGTLFLDEVGDLSLPGQAKLLRVLQEQRFERLGGNESVHTQARVLAATNKNLDVEVSAGRFRADLLYRLRVILIHVPPLRERLDDVPDLASYFITRFNRELGLTLRKIHPKTLERLQGHSWPGNVRELQSVLRQAMLLSTGPDLLPEFLPPLMDGATPVSGSAGAGLSELEVLIDRALADSSGQIHQAVIDAVERLLFSRLLRFTHGHQGRASELLGLNRATLRSRLRALGMGIDRLPVDRPGETGEA